MEAMRFAHKGLRRLADEDDAKGLPAHLVPRIRGILAELTAARSGRDMDLPGYRLHPLKVTGAAIGVCAYQAIGASSSASWMVKRRILN